MGWTPTSERHARARRVFNGTATVEVLFFSNYYSVGHKVDKVEPNN